MTNYPLPSLAEYVHWLSESGTRAFVGSERMAWFEEFTRGVVTRLPRHCIGVPTRSELNVAFSHNCFAAQYLIEPDAQHPANRWLYVANKTYDFGKLGPSVRRHIRQSQRKLRFTDMSWDELRQYGEAAYCQTNVRHNRPETTREAFLAYVDMFSQNPAHHVIGAWFEDRLVAFTTIMMVDDWVEMVGLFMTDADRNHCHPSEGLYYHALEKFVLNGPCQVVCIGLGGMLEDRRPGLHLFKVSVGFQAVPVHRAFATPLWIRPLLNPVTLVCAKTALKVNPGNGRLRRAIRTLDEILYPQPLPVQQDNASDEPSLRSEDSR